MNKLSKILLSLGACSMLIGCSNNNAEVVKSAGEAFKEKIKQWSAFKYERETAIFINEIDYIYLTGIRSNFSFGDEYEKEVGNVFMRAKCIEKTENNEKSTTIYGAYCVNDASISISVNDKLSYSELSTYVKNIDNELFYGCYGLIDTL